MGSEGRRGRAGRRILWLVGVAAAVAGAREWAFARNRRDDTPSGPR